MRANRSNRVDVCNPLMALPSMHSDRPNHPLNHPEASGLYPAGPKVFRLKVLFPAR